MVPENVMSNRAKFARKAASKPGHGDNGVNPHVSADHAPGNPSALREGNGPGADGSRLDPDLTAIEKTPSGFEAACCEVVQVNDQLQRVRDVLDECGAALGNCHDMLQLVRTTLSKNQIVMEGERQRLALERTVLDEEWQKLAEEREVLAMSVSDSRLPGSHREAHRAVLESLRRVANTSARTTLLAIYWRAFRHRLAFRALPTLLFFLLGGIVRLLAAREHRTFGALADGCVWLGLIGLLDVLCFGFNALRKCPIPPPPAGPAPAMGSPTPRRTG